MKKGLRALSEQAHICIMRMSFFKNAVSKMSFINYCLMNPSPNVTFNRLMFAWHSNRKDQALQDCREEITNAS